MTSAAKVPHNWFDHGGDAYARFRPDYPAAVTRFLAAASLGRACAVDVGCGTGQLTVQLARHFAAVIGVDPSADQLAHAAAHPRVCYVRARAEKLPLPDGCADLVSVAQAAHWFDLPCFYAEARRIGRQGAVVALASYGVPRFESAELDERFGRFYRREIGPWWPPQRRRVDSGYADLPFPFVALPAPDFSITSNWGVDDLLGYLSTWSATRHAVQAGRRDVLRHFASDLSRLWGSTRARRRLTWPVSLRLGRL